MKDADGHVDALCSTDEAATVEGESQPFETSSDDMRSSITRSGTRFPAWIVDSALRPDMDNQYTT